MDNQAILCKVINLLKGKICVNESLLLDGYFDIPLTGSVFGLESLELIYLFFSIEDDFNIKINCEEIVNYQFNTINGIVRLISKTINCL